MLHVTIHICTCTKTLKEIGHAGPILMTLSHGTGNCLLGLACLDLSGNGASFTLQFMELCLTQCIEILVVCLMQ